MRRHLITILLIAFAAFVVWALTFSDQPEPLDPEEADSPELVEETEQPEPADPAAGRAAPEPGGAPAAPSTPQPSPEVVDQPVEPIPGLHVVEVTQPQEIPVLGSTVPEEAENPYLFGVELTPYGAGLRYVGLSRYSTQVDEHVPYPVQRRLLYDIRTGPDGGAVQTYRYPMAAYDIVVNGERVYLYHQRWKLLEERTNEETAAAFALVLADGAGEPVLRITRTWRIEPGRYDIKLGQTLENLSGQPLRVRLSQYGPFEPLSRGGYIGDRRRMVVGYLQPYRDPDNPRKYITTDGFDRPRQQVIEGEETIWPAADGDPERDMAWVAMVNRYFAAALHASVDREDPAVVPLERQFPSLRRTVWDAAGEEHLGLMLATDPMPLAPAGQPGAARTLDSALYAGPMDPDILESDPAYAALELENIVLYSLGGFCAFLTFSWLADLLVAFLTLIETITFDWGVAIIVLVAVVRIILHPLTKRSQVNMMKMSKQMQTLQPQIDRLKKKYKDNQTKLNQEMMNLYREKGVNPAAMGLGCLPMLLQTPIWIALYAVLYFAIELRHEPAFWGVFQAISGGAWPFLADLSSPDHFIPLPEAAHFTIPFFNQTFDAINLLPILMAVVFFFQQKYMTASTPAQSEQARQQQAMMKWMVMLFPVFLFFAPSGLTLYILVSTTVGVIESRSVRKHLKELEAQGKLFEKKKPKEGGFMDRMMKAAEERQRTLEQQGGGGGGGGNQGPSGGGRGKKGKRRGRSR